MGWALWKEIHISLNTTFLLCCKKNICTLAISLRFNTNGNLHETIELSFEELQQQFGTNDARKEMIRNAVNFFKIFSSCGCKAVYIAGSFVSKKKYPGDIDLVFDLTEIDLKKLKRELPGFFGHNRHNNIGAIRRDLKCHLFTFKKGKSEIFEKLQYDRSEYPKGMVKISFQNAFNYD